jgi:hypothetical protein
MYLFIAIAVSISFFFFLNLGLVVKIVGLLFCVFSWLSNRNGILNIEGASQNPMVIQFMLIGSIGTIIGLISIALDIFH